MAGGNVNDHIEMLSAGGGKPKAVPCWLIRQWIGTGHFDLDQATGNKIGYNFKDHAKGKADYKAFLADEARKANIVKARKTLGAVPAPQGIAGAATEMNRREAEGVWGQPEMPTVGSEKVAENPKAEPKDCI
jgi:hypothetical protein